MNKFVFTSCVLLSVGFATVATAQSVKLSTSLAVEKVVAISGGVGNSKDGYYLLGMSGYELEGMTAFTTKQTLLRYSNATTSPVSEINLVPSERPNSKHALNDWFFIKGGVIHQTFPVFDKKAKEYAFYYASFDANGKTVKPATQLNTVPMENWTLLPDVYSHRFNSDSSQVLVWRTLHVGKAKDTSKIWFCTIDLASGKTNPSTVTIPVENENLLLQDVAIAKNGDVAISAKEDVKRGTFRNEENIQHHVYTYTPSTKKLTNVKITLEEGYINGLFPYYDANGDLGVTGNYMTKEKESKGLFYGKITNGAFGGKTVYDFASSTYSHLTGRSVLALRLKDRVKLDNGNTVFLFEEHSDFEKIVSSNQSRDFAEQQEDVTMHKHDPSRTRTIYTRYRGPIIASCIDASGKQLWQAQVLKNQNTSYGGYAKAQRGNDLYFFYNDKADNLTVNEPRKMDQFLDNDAMGKADIIMAHLDANGKVTRKQLDTPAADAKNRVAITPSTFVQTGPKQYSSIATHTKLMKGLTTKVMTYTFE